MLAPPPGLGAQVLPFFPTGKPKVGPLLSLREGSRFAPTCTMTEAKRFVYVLKNTESKPRFYAGLTSDVKGRLTDYNAGRCPHTAKHRPWRTYVVIEFPDEQRAILFERYLKSGSGRSFARRHFEE